MSSGSGIRLLAAGVVLIVALFAAGTARADEECRAECSEARRMCLEGALVANRVCFGRCQEAIEGAVARARRACDEEQLPPRRCALLVERAVATARRACHEECYALHRRARAECREELGECQAACTGELDPACVQSCREASAQCRDELMACVDPCRTTTLEALQACRESADRTQPELTARCFREALAAGRECSEGCHESHPCGSDLRMCLAECVNPAE